ncbi:MFS transporter [Fibrisoma montanum]|uniref:MFS transporter n=1 Tax=Fibrisoma montanum TaxID=2305895 RepID=A0A418M994_9BACT|nr:MFS transporter [Fibrisoma montanum]RIV22662.1 MFS transporter [Fibrisoma montanum]
MVTSHFPSHSHALTLSESRPLRYGVFLYLYIMQGIPAGFYTTALTNYFAAEGVRPDVVGAFVAVIGLPWAFQFVWGPLIDRFQQSPMGRRKPWVVGSQLMSVLTSLTLLSVSEPVAQISLMSWLFFTRSIFAAIQDASVDAMAISVIPENERGRVNAFMRSGFLIGYGGGAAVFAQILRVYDFHTAALTQTACLLTGAVLMYFVRERRGDQLLPGSARSTTTSQAASVTAPDQPDHDFRWLFTELFRGLFSRKSLLIFVAVILAYTSVSLFLRAYNYHLIRQLGWRDTDLSVLTGTYGMFVATGVALAGGYVADRIGPSRLLIFVLILVAGYLIGFNLIPRLWEQRDIARTGLVALFFMDPSISVAAMPVLMAICRKGVEGSQFTTYMAFVNLCDIAGTYVSGEALNFFPAPVIGIAAGGLALVAFTLAFFTLRHYRAVGQG